MQRPNPPLPKGGASACRGGGIPQAKPGNFLPITYSLFTKKLSLFHIGWYFEEVPTVNPSVTPPACQLPLAREPAGSARGHFRTGLVCNRYFPDPPGIVLLCHIGFFSLSIDSVGRKHPKIPQTQTGVGAKTHHPSQSEGSIPDGSSRGILKGGIIRAGASCSPLKPDNFPSFLAGARK